MEARRAHVCVWRELKTLVDVSRFPEQYRNSFVWGDHYQEEQHKSLLFAASLLCILLLFLTHRLPFNSEELHPVSFWTACKIWQDICSFMFSQELLLFGKILSPPSPFFRVSFLVDANYWGGAAKLEWPLNKLPEHHKSFQILSEK